jgi:WD40 repeat protein
VFVSYSHADEVWLRRLGVLFKGYEMRGRLQVWADPYIQVGDRWERAIEGAMARARIGVLLTSASFLASEFIFGVELPALVAAAAAGEMKLFCIPVGAADRDLLADLLQYQWPRPPDRPLDRLKEASRNAAMVELVAQLVALFGAPALADKSPAAPGVEAVAVAPLRADPASTMGALHGVPELPLHFVPRAAAIDELRASLLDGGRQRLGVTAGGAAGLYGQGGIGKSVLAAAVARDETLRRAFADGVYWLALGQQPSPIALQQELWRMLTGERADFEGVPTGAERLRERLREATCLLVLDDAWQEEHIAALDVVGPRSRLLVTTRDRRLLARIEASVQSLEVLAPEDALALLAKWAGAGAGIDPAGRLPPEASAVARECGFLPLALALAGAQVRDGAAWSDVAAALQAGDLEFLDHPHGSIFKSLGASVRALPADEAERYRELAVFPEDTPIPDDVVVRLWGAADLSAPRARKLLSSFASRALLTLSGEGEGERTVVAFHDLQGDYLRLIAGDLPAAHARLLAACYQALPGAELGPARWASLPAGDRYLWSHLLHHVVEAGDTATAQALVTDVRWLAAKAAATGVSSLLTDLAMLADRAPAPAIRRIERALRLEGGWLHQDPEGLPGLLYNRLRCDGLDVSEIERLVPSLRPAVRLVHPVRMGGGEHRIFRGHTSSVSACVYSGDGRRILSASDDRTLREWDRETGQELRRFEGHAAVVNACAYSGDGRRILSASYDKTLREWDRETGQELRRFEGHTAGVNACAYSGDGRRILSASGDGTLREWDQETGRELRRFAGHTSLVNACAYSGDGRRILSASYDKTLREWDQETGRELRRFEGHTGSVNACAYSGDGRRILSASADGTLREWDQEMARELCRFIQMGCVNACAYSGDGRRILSASADGTLREWDQETGQELRRFEGHTTAVLVCAYSGDRRRILSASADGTLREWDREMGQELRRFEGHTGSVRACAYSGDGRRILSASWDETLREWDQETGQELRRLEGHMTGVNACAYPGDGRRILLASADGTLREWDCETGQELRRFEGHTEAVIACAYSGDGRRILSASADGTLREWDRETAQELRRFEDHTSSVNACAYSGDGRRVLSASWDETLREWDRDTGQEIHRFEGHTAGVNACAYSGDGRRILSASFDQTLREWDRKTGQELRRFDGHTRSVDACAYSPGGAYIVSASADATLKIWAVSSGRCVHTVRGAAAFSCVAVAPGRLAAGDDAGNVWMLDCDLFLPPGDAG